MLVGARWLAGFLFRWSDLELLDDPIPETLYCQNVRNWKQKSSISEMEGGGEEGGGDGGENEEKNKVEGEV